MTYQYDYVDTHEPTNAIHLYPNEEEAIFSLYEQLFCNRNAVCKETILQAMQYLIFIKGMTDQWEEIRHMDVDDVDVVHHQEVEKAKEETTQEFKEKLYEILEDKIF
jgi:hypothetical protein